MFHLSKTQLFTSPQFILLKGNIVYLIAIILFIFLGVSFLPQQIVEYSTIRQQNKELVEINTKLTHRLRLIDSLNIKDLNQLLIILNTLEPQQEDKFSINPVVDNLQVVTGMLFVKKGSPFDTHIGAQVVIPISAIATLDQIKVLLQEYPYKAARLITLESLAIRPDKTSPLLWDVDFSIAFHSNEVSAGKKTLDTIDPKAIDFARQVQQYFVSRGATYSNVSIKEDDIPLNYPIKQNPFGNN